MNGHSSKNTDCVTIPSFDITVSSEKVFELLGFENIVKLLPDRDTQLSVLANQVSKLKLDNQRKNVQITKLRADKKILADRYLDTLKLKEESDNRARTINLAFVAARNERDLLKSNGQVCTKCLVKEFMEE